MHQSPWPGPLNAGSCMETEHRAPRGEQPSVPWSPRLSAAVCNASRALIPRSSPFRPQMEPKKSSAQHQVHIMEPKKSSPRRAGAATATKATTETESPLSSLFNPPSPGAKGKDQELYSILYKGQSGNAQADGKTQWSPSKTAYGKDGKNSPPYDPVDTSCFGSSVHYGGREYFHGSSTAKQATGSSTDYKAKVDKNDPAADSHGDWWQGSFYY